ncbi:MAG: sugar ABC transporter ATP-binding protein [Atribacterota bacterium]
MANIMIAFDHISKSFPGVQALNDVSFSIAKGEVHGLVGENGAGKSTLIKILSGIITDYEGRVFIDGQAVAFRSPHHAQSLGVATIFQELTMIRELPVFENIFLGREPVLRGGIIDRNSMREQSQKVLRYLDSTIHPDDLVGRLSIANQQIVEICKALVLNAKVIVMDEPTSSLTEHEVEQLFSLIQRLKDSGITVIYVSHKIEEIFRICDMITVLRDGKYIGSVQKNASNPDEVIRMMVGRSMNERFPFRERKRGQKLLEVRNLSRKGEFEEVSFSLYQGEIVGFAGLIGAGRTELARTLFGATYPHAGEIQVKQRIFPGFSNPREAFQAGIAYLPEDRKGEGLVLCLPVRENIALSILRRLSSRLWVDRQTESRVVDRFIKDLQIKVYHPDQIVETLSGGNQQKVVISKLLATKSEIFIFDEPTRGIDVGAKYEIYKIMNDLTQEGKGIIFISSELPEIMGISDRIYCMRGGRLVKEFRREEVTPEKIMYILTGGREQ